MAIKKINPNEVPKVVIDEVLMKQIAAMSLGAMPTYTEIAHKLGYSRQFIKKIMDGAEFQSLLKGIAEEELTPLITKSKLDMTRLLPKAIKVIEHKLDEDDLDAAKTVLKVSGIEQQEAKPQDASITVILPGNPEPKTIDVEVVDK